MAVDGSSLAEPHITETIEVIRGLPLPGPLLSLSEFTVVETATSQTFVNRFPTPPVAWGFLVDVVPEDPDLLLMDYAGVQDVLASALSVEGSHLEPTHGQIWPRIG